MPRPHRLPPEAEPDVTPSPATEEPELIRRAVHDPDAFATLYRTHHQAIARCIRRRVGDVALVEDLVADTFVVALQELPRFEHRGVPLRAWLYRIATSRVNRWVRREGRRQLRALEAEPVSPEPSDSERREVARAALLSLPVRWQSVLALHYMEGLSVAEVARVLDCSEGTVKSRLSRGRDALRARLQQMRWTP